MFAVGTLYSCQENDRMIYSSKASVYFQLFEEPAKEDLDSINYAFSSSIGSVDTFNLNVKVIGEVVDYDRNLNMEVVPELTTATEGKHYIALEKSYIVPAGAYKVSVPIILLNQDTLLKDTSFRIGFRILESNDFLVGAIEKSEVKLILTDILVKPASWMYLSMFFGEYNRTKHKYFIEIFDTNFPEDPRDIFTEFGLWQTYGQLLSDYFKENYPIYDENDEIVEPWK